MEKKLHWGIIGCGNVTEKKSGPAFYRLPACSLEAVMRRDREKAADYARRHGAKRFYSDAGDLIGDPAVEAVYIATPPASHAALAIRTLEQGKPVYVEKPMARTYAECRAMLDAAQRTGTPLYVAYYRREMDYFRKVKQLLDEGAVGKIRRIGLRLCRTVGAADKKEPRPWRLDPAVSGGGYFIDMGAHQLDLLFFLFGAPDRHESVVANRGGWYEPEDYVETELYWSSGLTARGIWDFAAPDEADEFEIEGSDGSLYFSTFSFAPIRLTTRRGTTTFSIPRPEVVEEAMIRRITREILSGTYSGNGLADAAEVSRLMEAIVRPYYANK